LQTKIKTIKMKKILLLLSVTAIMVSCNKTDGEFKIVGTAADIDGKTIILQKQDTVNLGAMVNIDTVKVENGKFEFEGIATEPIIGMLVVEGKGNVDFVLETGDIKAAINKDTLVNSVVSGTYNNDELTSFKKEITVIQKDLSVKSKAFQDANMDKMKEARAKNDTVVIKALVDQHQTIMKPLADKNWQYAETHPKSFLSALLTEGFFFIEKPEVARIKKIYNSFSSDLKNTRPGKAIKARIDAIENIVIGNVAPDFKAKSPEGKEISLKQSLGKVTIIDFWASWCMPCRQENPNVVALYNEFHEKGLNIIGVSLDQPNDGAKWKQAIEQDKLTWPQISNLKGWQDPIAQKYNVKSIPATFILDASGKIVAKDLRGEELKAKVKELLGA